MEVKQDSDGPQTYSWVWNVADEVVQPPQIDVEDKEKVTFQEVISYAETSIFSELSSLFERKLITREEMDELEKITHEVLNSSDHDYNVGSTFNKFPMSAGSIIHRLQTIMSMPSSFRTCIQRSVWTEDLEDYFTNSFLFGSSVDAVAWSFIAGAQKVNVQKQINEQVMESKEFNQVDAFDSPFFNKLLFFDSELAFKYIQSRSENCEAISTKDYLTVVKVINSHPINLEKTDQKLATMIQLISDASRVPIGTYDVICSALQMDNSTQLTTKVVETISLIFSNKQVCDELAKADSPYIPYVKKMFSDSDPESIFEILEARVQKTNVNFLQALLARTRESCDSDELVVRASKVNTQTFEKPLEIDITAELLESRVEQIYVASMTQHDSVDTSPLLFEDNSRRTYFVRGNSFKSVQNILKTGCFAQEFIPYLPSVSNNLLPGFLNNYAIEDARARDAISFAMTDQSLREYGGKEAILLFQPSETTKDLTGYHKTKVNDRTQALTLVGMSSNELVGILIGDNDNINSLIADMVACEKYVPIFDLNGRLVFSPSDYNQRIETKPFQSIEIFLNSLTIHDLANEQDGHGEGSLLEHTVRVMESTGTFVGDSDIKVQTLIKLAAALHDIGKNTNDIGEQADKNTSLAASLLDQIRGLGLLDKELILLAIKHEEEIGKILQTLSSEADSIALSKARSAIEMLFPSPNHLKFGLDLYYADVAGIGTSREMLTNWQVDKKLELLGFKN